MTSPNVDRASAVTPAPERAPAIVTGAARGIGAAVAAALHDAGHPVAILDVDAEAAEAAAERIGPPAIAVGADVRDRAGVQDAVRRVSDELGPPLILVNNAGVVRDASFHRMTDADWDLVLDVHLKGAFIVAKSVQSHMVRARWGRIVNMSSVSALGLRGQSNYSSAKAGLGGLTRTLAIELGRFGVTVNSVAPGFIDTQMTRETAARLGTTWDDYCSAIIERIPAGRPGTPTDVAGAVLYFVSGNAGFVSGQTLYVAGGPRG